MGNRVCGAPPSVLSPAGDDLAPCFELLFRFATFFYLFVIAALSVAPLRNTPIDRNAIDVNSRTDFILAALAAVQNLVLVVLDLAGVSPLSFPGFPEFRLHYFAAIVAWSISAALLRATAQRHLRVPRHHALFWWMMLVLDGKRVETGVLRLIQQDSLRSAWDSVGGLVEFCTIVALLLYHHCFSEQSDNDDQAYLATSTTDMIDSAYSIDTSPFHTAERSSRQIDSDGPMPWNKLFSSKSAPANDTVREDYAPPHLSHQSPIKTEPVSFSARKSSMTTPTKPISKVFASPASQPPAVWSETGSADAPRTELPIQLSVPQFSEGTVVGRNVIQFCIRVQSKVLPLGASGEYSVWRTVSDFQVLQKQCAAMFRPRQLPTSRDSTDSFVPFNSQAPALPPALSTILVESPDAVRMLLNNFLAQLLTEPSLAQTLASFCDLDKHVKKGRSASEEFFPHTPTSVPLGRLSSIPIREESFVGSPAMTLSDIARSGSVWINAPGRHSIDQSDESNELSSSLSIRPQAIRVSMDATMSPDSFQSSATDSTLAVGSMKEESLLGGQLSSSSAGVDHENAETRVARLLAEQVSENEEQSNAFRNRGYLHVGIVGWSRYQPEGLAGTSAGTEGKQYTTYTIALRGRRSTHVNADVSDWCVRRRYSEFDSLFDSLKVLFGAAVPELPAGSAGFLGLGSQTSRPFLDKRRRLLEAWLQRVVNSRRFHSAPLLEFLCPTNPAVVDAANAAARNSRSELPLPAAPTDATGIPHSLLDSSEHVNVFADPAWGSHFFECDFARWGTQQSGKREVAVHSFVVREFYSRTEFISWTIQKRYSAFETLFSALHRACPDVPTPPLPSKFNDVTNISQADRIVDRCVGLELFLQQLSNTSAFQLEPFFQFIELNNPERDIATGTRRS